ncbi:efflux RND transporter permease subunit [Ancylomarina sp. 16SWW S1-10-2]|uniref:efflux RND transporter permease subunit n=1 Tax=Ancylomarina sp. 16SWW S1-10-2 TaxID=2499681 RepID=UPI0012AE1536|nr:efflux RND transporter permease subunit [Ancylomarina sp. 16SWW S1-10-2]MRT94252.1 efflux RND transporter permease subunit [Ancylomarina sp. 16SWW S1-10-2]
MKSLIKYFIKYPFAGNLLAGVFMILGMFGVFSLNSSVMPQIDPGMLTITAVYPGASPEEVEKGVALKIEDNLKGVSGVEKVTSSSKENYCSIMVDLESGYDPNIALQDVKNKVDGISSFPAAVENISVSKREFSILAIAIAISGDVELKDLKGYARAIENDLRGIDGISQVELSGFPDEVIEVSVNEDALKSYNITIDEIYSAVAAANIDQTGGTIRGENEELRIRVREKQYYAEGFKDIVVRSQENGGTVRLSDLADVNDQWDEVPNRTYIDGNPAVKISITQTSREDILFISEAINKYVAEYNTKHETVKLNVLQDNSSSIKVMQNILANNGIVGFLLVLLFLSLFLNHRLSFWVAIGIPISFMGMFMIAGMYGLTLNRISLFGMIIVIGILVDDGIVICENIFQHYEKGKSALQAGIDGTFEVMPAVFSAVLTTIVAFSAFFFIDGLMGEFFRELAFVVIFALSFSLVEAFLILPAHVVHSKALRADKKESKIERMSLKAVTYLRRWTYEPLIRFALDNKLVTIGFSIGLFAITVGALRGGIIRTGDSSVADNDYIDVELEMPAGTPENETLSYMERIENAAIEVGKDLQDKSINGDPVITGSELNITASNIGKLKVYLLGTQERNFISTEFSNLLKEKVGGIPQAQLLSYTQQSRFGKAVSISLQSSNLDDLYQAKNEFKASLSNLEGLMNVLDNDQLGMREVKLKLKDSGYKLGLTQSSLSSQVRAGFYGREVQRLQRGIDVVKVWVRYPKDERSSVGNLENMRIRTANGGEYYLKDVADIIYERNLVQINHLEGQREITVEADAANSNVNMSEINTEIEEHILPSLQAKYPGLRFRYGGHEENMQKAKSSGIIIAPVILVLLFAIVIFTFRSYFQTILIFTLVPLGFIGVGWGHWIHGVALDMPSYLGMVALMGVMVNDSIVLISTFNEQLKTGKDFMTALYDACVSRFRPIVLTSLTTIVGIAPLIVSNQQEAKMVIPMAISMAYGLATATFLNLVLLPVLLVVVNSIKCKYKWLVTGVMPSRESVETAVKELVE